MERAQLIIDHARELVPYEERGIPTLSSPPSELVAEYRTKRADILVETLQDTAEQARTKSGLASTPSGKVNPLAKLVLDVQAARAEYADVAEVDGRLDDLERSAEQLHHHARLRTFVEAAEKAEFKGQLKKALDQYQEALYFLRTDDVPDSAQSEEIATMEAKIGEIKNTLSS